MMDPRPLPAGETDCPVAPRPLPLLQNRKWCVKTDHAEPVISEHEPVLFMGATDQHIIDNQTIASVRHGGDGPVHARHETPASRTFPDLNGRMAILFGLDE